MITSWAQASRQLTSYAVGYMESAYNQELIDDIIECSGVGEFIKN